METLYYAFFCVAIGGIIFWGFRYDDQAEFQGQSRSKKFVVRKRDRKDLPLGK
jgi:hypothetical protein